MSEPRSSAHVEAADRGELLQRSPVFCLAPWTHLHVLPSGQIFPCCMSAHRREFAVGDLARGDTLEQAWNAAPMRALRANMLAGRRSPLCERCYQQEELGQQSFRTSINFNLAHHAGRAAETASDGRLEGIRLPYLDIRFSNLCNYKCRICHPDLSSRWHDDAVAVGTKRASDPKLLHAGGDPEALWRQLEPLLPYVERIQFAGGEPLLMEEHYRILDLFLERGMTGVDITYNTNLSVLRFRDWDVPELWSRFSSVFVMASLDGSGARGDYMRKGQRWERVVANRERTLRECPNVHFQVYPTVSVMNALHVPDFYRDWVEKGYIRSGDMTLNILFDPEHYNVRTLPPALKRRVEEKYRAFFEGFLADLGPAADPMRRQLEAVLEYMNGAQLDVWPRFRWMTERLDELRGERFDEIFPELRESTPQEA